MTSAGPRKSISPRKILVAEDDPLVAHTIRMALIVDGHTVEVAQDGEQALAMFKDGDYDLVITDFRMAKMDGLELAEAIKKLSPTKPIILITAYLEAIKTSMGNVSNVDLLLGKPFSVRDLQAALVKFFPDR
jgi:two-component system, sensor histidine kinase and response regulator